MRKILKNILCLGLICSFIFSCSTTEQMEYKKIKNYLNDNFANYDSNERTCILLLTENGCIPCNRNYAKFVEKNFIEKKNSYIVVCASGAMVDISPFILNGKKNNVYEDQKEVFRKEIYSYSSAIFLNEKKVDTIVQITFEDTEKTMDYILSKYKEINN